MASKATQKLWAPWRSRYIYCKKQKSCIFCGGSVKANTKKRYIVDRSKHSFAMLNIYPYNNGHIMVAPYRHVKSLRTLSDEEMLDLMRLVTKMKDLLDKKMKPHAFNIGMNIGRLAGAGFDGHIHVHIVPRWSGDTNFMPVVGGTKVLSDSLEALYSRLIK